MGRTQHFSPGWVSKPGDTIVDALRERNLSLIEFAKKMGESAEAVDALLDGRAAITIGTARRLHEILGASVEFWISRDFKYREGSSKREGKEIKQWVDDLPVGDMIRFGWLTPPPHPSEELAACLRFFGVPDIESWQKTYATLTDNVAYRTSRSLDSRPASVAAWLRRAAIEATALNCGDWNPDRFRESLTKARALTRQKDPSRFIPRLQRICADSGVAVVVVRAPAGCRASGATQFLDDNKPLLVLSGRYLTDDQFWFTFFHEAGHLLLHGHRRLILEGLGSNAEIEEQQANAFADALIVPTEHRRSFSQLRANARQIIRFARNIGVSPGLLVGQLQHRGVLRPNQLNGMKRRFTWTDAELVSREKA